MPKFRIRAALGGSFGGCENAEWEEVEAKDLDDANSIAYERAVEEYQMYEGMHGLRTVEEIAEEDGVSLEEAEHTYRDEMESWLDYEAEPITSIED